jgi:zinc transport system ATP-binding protein
MKVVEVRGVTFGYDGHQVLKDLSLTVEKGDVFALLGPNGAGKTTLVRLLLGLERPRQGKIMLFGTEAEKFSAWSRVGYVPQKAISFDRIFPVTVEEVVLSGRFGRLGPGRRPGREDRRAADEALEALEILPLRKALLKDLSGGQQQRVFLARALAGRPELLVLDEPEAGLDGRTLESFYRLLGRLNREKGTTAVVVSHDTGAVARWATKAALLNQVLLYCGPPQGLFSSGSSGGPYFAPGCREQACR